MFRRTAIVVVIAGVLVSVHPQPAFACSLSGRVPLLEMINTGADQPEDEISGVYEQRHIARVPSIFVRNARSVSIVDRYWGEPPDLSMTVHGEGGWFGTECGNSANQVEATAVGVTTTGSSLDQRRFSYTGFEPLSDIEADILTARFGPPVIQNLGFLDYAFAYGLLLWQPVALLAALATAAVLERRFWSKGGYRKPNMLLAGFALSAATISMVVDFALYGGSDLSQMVVVVALIAAAAWLSRTAYAVAAALLAVYGWLGKVFSFDGFLNPGLAIWLAIILGVSALLWTGDHWSRWPASITVVVASPLVWGWAGPVIAAAGTAAVLSWETRHQVRQRRGTPHKEPSPTDA